jgi:hypothetical protein
VTRWTPPPHTAVQLRAALCGQPALFGHVAEVDGEVVGEVVGFALWFLNFYLVWRAGDLPGGSVRASPSTGGRGWAGSCWVRWPRSVCVVAAPGCRGGCLTGTNRRGASTAVSAWCPWRRDRVLCRRSRALRIS